MSRCLICNPLKTSFPVCLMHTGYRPGVPGTASAPSTDSLLSQLGAEAEAHWYALQRRTYLFSRRLRG